MCGWWTWLTAVSVWRRTDFQAMTSENTFSTSEGCWSMGLWKMKPSLSKQKFPLPPSPGRLPARKFIDVWMERWDWQVKRPVGLGVLGESPVRVGEALGAVFWIITQALLDITLYLSDRNTHIHTHTDKSPMHDASADGGTFSRCNLHFLSLPLPFSTSLSFL